MIRIEVVDEVITDDLARGTFTAESIGDEKMVRVDVERDGKALTVRMEAGELRRADSSYYATWHMDAPSRRAFAEAFGRSADLHARDIVRIGYAKRVLYERGGAHGTSVA